MLAPSAASLASKLTPWMQSVNRGVGNKAYLSWWATTGPPIFGCLKMYMDCTGSGRLKPSARNTASMRSLRENIRKTGSRSCSAWPHLFMERALSCTRLPSSWKEFSSKKNETLAAESRKYAFVVTSCTMAHAHWWYTVQLGIRRWDMLLESRLAHSWNTMCHKSAV